MANDYVSASQLADFDYCPRQWALKQELRLNERSPEDLKRVMSQSYKSNDPRARKKANIIHKYLKYKYPSLVAGETFHEAHSRATQHGEMIASMLGTMGKMVLAAGVLMLLWFIAKAGGMF